MAVLRNRKPQEHTALAIGVTRVRPLRSRHSRTKHMLPSHHHCSQCSAYRLMPCRSHPQGFCCAQPLPRCLPCLPCPIPILCTIQSKAAAAAAAVSRLRLRSIQRQHHAMQLITTPASKLLIVMPGPARTWPRRVRVRRSDSRARRFSLCAGRAKCLA